jgi:transposase
MDALTTAPRRHATLSSKLNEEKNSTYRRRAEYHTCNIRVDRFLAEGGHRVLRLLPYRPEFNRIELIWTTVNIWVADRNLSFRIEDVIKLANEKFISISKRHWKLRCCPPRRYRSTSRRSGNFRALVE